VTQTDYINVIERPPTAEFSASLALGVRPLTVTFTDNSNGVITGRQWDFGDGSTSTQQNPTHVYAAAGTYTVSLQVSGPGGVDKRIRANAITVSETPPDVDFVASSTSGVLPLNVTFTDTSIGAATDWLWDFGDAAASTEQKPIHVYTTAGAYTVSLTVKGPGGSNTRSKSNYINITTPQVNPLRSVLLLPASSMSDGLAGTDLQYVLTLSNTGNVADLYTVSITSAWPTTCSVASVLQPSAGSSIFNVKVRIPSSASGGDENRAQVTVRSQVSPTVMATAWITTIADGLATVTPEGGFLIFTDTQGNQTSVQVGPAAVTDTVTLILAPFYTVTSPNGYAFAGHAFNLSAYVGSVQASGYVFKSPITVTINYSDPNVTGLDETTLKLLYWTGSEWVDAADTCIPVSRYVYDPIRNRFVLPICHLTRFIANSEIKKGERGIRRGWPIRKTYASEW
jgi:PKD repeat protein